MMTYARTTEDDALISLHRWLGYEVGSGLLVGLIFLLPFGIVITGLYVLMAIFIPVMLRHLYTARWYGSIATFILLVGSGWVIPRMMDMDPRMIQSVHAIGVFVPFYFYCWFLRWIVGDKVSEIKALGELSRMEATDRQEE